MRTERLRDRLVSGIRDDKMLRDLLKEKLEDLTFDKAVAKCIDHEQASLDVNALKGDSESNAKVHVLSTSKPRGKPKQNPKNVKIPKKPEHEREQNTKPSEQSCYRCGEHHDPKQCKFKKEKCHHCGKVGHIKKVCYALTKRQPGVHALQTCSDEEDVGNHSLLA